MSVPLLRIDHVANPSFDPAATHRFYTDVLGAQLTLAASGTTGGGQRYLVAEYAFGGVGLAFLTYEGTPRPAADGLPDDIRHVAFTVHDRAELERWQARFTSAGVRFRIEDHGEDGAPDPHVYAYDPNGVVLEFAQPWLAGAGSAERAAATLADWFAGTP